MVTVLREGEIDAAARYFQERSKAVVASVSSSLEQYRNAPKIFLNEAEEQLTTKLNELFLPLIPDLLVSDKLQAVYTDEKSTSAHYQFKQYYKTLKKYWPTFVFPHFRGSIVSGKRETAILISQRACNANWRQFSDNRINLFLELFHEVYINAFGLQNTITERVARTIDDPDSKLHKLVDRGGKSLIVNLQMWDTANVIEQLVEGEDVIVSVRFNKGICAALLKSGQLDRSFINFIWDYFKKDKRDKKTIVNYANYIAEKMREGVFPLSKKLSQQRDFVKLSLMEKGKGDIEFLMQLYRFLRFGKVKKVPAKNAEIARLPDEMEKEIDSILIWVQAILVYTHVLGIVNKSVALFYTPTHKKERPFIYPRCSGACYWKLSPPQNVLGTFSRFFRQGYNPIRGFIESQLNRFRNM